MKKKLGKLIVIFFVLATGPVNAQMVGYWEFEGNANDSSGNGNNSSLMDNATYGGGVYGMALALDGFDDYVSVENESDFDITDEITVAAWIKMPVSIRGSSAIISKGDNAWRLQMRGHYRIKFDCDGLEPKGVKTGITMNDHQWHHVAGVYDGTQLCIYVDGVIRVSQKTSGKIRTNDSLLYIGENSGKLGREWKGFIDEVVVFDHALNADEIEELYTLGVVPFAHNGYMAKLVEEIENIIKNKEPEEAVAFIEKKIAESKKWRESNPNNARFADDLTSSELYFFSAKAKEASGFPKDDVVAEYKRAFSSPFKAGAALAWLSENVPIDRYRSIVKDFVRDNMQKHLCVGRYRYIIGQFKSDENWPAFKQFLDAAFGAVDEPVVFARLIERAMGKNSTWQDKYFEYCRSRPQLMEYAFSKDREVAERYEAEGNFEKAAEKYRDIANLYDTIGDKLMLELKICECLFKLGDYENMISALDELIKRDRTNRKGIVTEAILIKGRLYIQLDKVDKATREFATLTMEYPESEHIPEVIFLTGYCHMRQSKFAEAREAFNTVIQNYSESSFANKAGLYLARINSMAK